MTDDILEEMAPVGMVSIDKTDNPHDNGINIAAGFVQAAFELAEHSNKSGEDRDKTCLACLAEGLIGATMQEVDKRTEDGRIGDLDPVVGGLLNVHKQLTEMIAHLAHAHGKHEGLTTTKH